ncbi:MAG: hypothetical protein JWM33_1759 [Caulobacteraceae bacterium]|nr:hypothetical protein [Caulobacteraceae bacterium]
MVRSGEATARLASDEERLLEATLRNSPLETAMRLRALEEIARTLDTSALVELAAQVSASARDQGGKIAWI